MTFADLHRGERPLLLPNAWDVPSALALLEYGFAAIGTTSFGVASSIGTPDGGRSTKQANLRLAATLRPLDCYISIDIEDGYADDPDQVADYVARLPVDGINIEDSTAEKLIEPQQHAAKVQAIKQRSPDVFVNARVDTYWLGQDATVAATLDRALCESKVQRVATTDLDRLTGDEGRLVGTQEQHRRDDVIHRADPVHELESIDELLDQLSRQIG